MTTELQQAYDLGYENGFKAYRSPVVPELVGQARKIKEIVCEHYQITWEQILNRDRKQVYALPRMIMQYLLMKYTKMGGRPISRVFKVGNCTIIGNYRTIQDRMETDPELKKSINLLIAKIQQP